MAAPEIDPNDLLPVLAGREVLSQDPETTAALIVRDDNRRVPKRAVDRAAGAEADHVTGDGDAARRRHANAHGGVAAVHDAHEVGPVTHAGAGSSPDPVDRPEEACR